MSTNLAELRRKRRLTTAALSELLGQLGRPILANGITKIEKGSRRVDTDDLMALAIALDVTPNALLLPPKGGDVELTPTVTVPASLVWRWATGDMPIPAHHLPHSVDDSPGREGRFRQENRPHDPGNYNILRLMAENPDLFEAIRTLVQAAKHAGVPIPAVRDYVMAVDALTSTKSFESAPAGAIEPLMQRAQAVLAGTADRGEARALMKEFEAILEHYGPQSGGATSDDEQMEGEGGSDRGGEGTDS